VARKVLVTGGAGFIGSHLTETLVRQGDHVTVVDNLSTGRSENLTQIRDRIRFIEGDLANPRIATESVQGCEIVFHLAAIPSVLRSLDDPLACHASGTTATLNVLWAASNASVRRVIFAGSAAAYGLQSTLPHTETMLPDALSPYAATKVAGEYYLKAFSAGKGLDTVTLRYFNVFGPRQDPDSPYSGVIAIFVQRMTSGEPPILFGDGEQIRDFVYVDDAVQANLLAADSPSRLNGTVLNVGTGSGTSVNKLVVEVNRILGTNLEPVHQNARSGEVRDSVADISRIREILGYEPLVSLQEGLARLIDSAATQVL